MDLNDELLRQLAADTDSVREKPLTRLARFGAHDSEASDSEAEGSGAGPGRSRRRRSGVDPITALRKGASARTSADITAIRRWLGEQNPNVRRFFRCLRGMGEEHVDELLRTVRLVKVRHGTLLYKQGDAGTSFFILLSGRVAVYHKPHHASGATTAPTAADAGAPAHTLYGTTGSEGLRLLNNQEAVVGGLVGYTKQWAVGLLSCTGDHPRLHSAIAVHGGGSGPDAGDQAGGDGHQPILVMDPVTADDRNTRLASSSGDAVLLQVDGRTYDKYSSFLRTVIAGARRRMEVLQSNYTLQLLPELELLFLASVANVSKKKPGTIVHAEGDDVRSISVLMHGVVNVTCVHVPPEPEQPESMLKKPDRYPIGMIPPSSPPTPKAEPKPAADGGMFGGKSGGTLTLELVRGPALLGEVEVVRHTMLGVPRDEDGRIRRCVSATVGGSSAATIAMFNWHLFNNVVCQNADPETQRRVRELAEGRWTWYEMRKDYQFSGESQTLSPVFLEGVQCQIIGCHLCGAKTHGVNECDGTEAEEPGSDDDIGEGGGAGSAGSVHSGVDTPRSVAGSVKSGRGRASSVGSEGSMGGAPSRARKSGPRDLARLAAANAMALGGGGDGGGAHGDGDGASDAGSARGGSMQSLGSARSLKGDEDWNSTPRSAGRSQKRQARTSVKSSLRAVLKAVTKFKRLLLRRRARQAAEDEAKADAEAGKKRKKRRRRRRGQRVSATSAVSGDGAGAVVDHVLGLPGDGDSNASSYETDSDADDDIITGSIEPRKSRRSFRLSTSREFSSANVVSALVGTHSSNRMSVPGGADTSPGDDARSPMRSKGSRNSFRSPLSPTRRRPRTSSSTHDPMAPLSPTRRRIARHSRGSSSQRVSFHVPDDASDGGESTRSSRSRPRRRRARRHTVSQPPVQAAPQQPETHTDKRGRMSMRELRRPGQLTTNFDDDVKFEPRSHSGAMTAKARLGTTPSFTATSRRRSGRRGRSPATSPSSTRSVRTPKGRGSASPKSPRPSRHLSPSPLRLAPIPDVAEEWLNSARTADSPARGSSRSPSSRRGVSPTSRGARHTRHSTGATTSPATRSPHTGPRSPSLERGGSTRSLSPTSLRSRQPSLGSNGVARPPPVSTAKHSSSRSLTSPTGLASPLAGARSPPGTATVLVLQSARGTEPRRSRIARSSISSMTGGGMASPTSRTRGMLATVGSSGKLEQVAVVDVDALVKEVTADHKASTSHGALEPGSEARQTAAQELDQSPGAPAATGASTNGHAEAATGSASGEHAGGGEPRPHSLRGLDSLLAGGGVTSAQDGLPSPSPMHAAPRPASTTPELTPTAQDRDGPLRTPSPVVMPPARRRRHGIMGAGTGTPPTSGADSTQGDSPDTRLTIQPTALPNGNTVFGGGGGTTTSPIAHGAVRTTSPPLSPSHSSPNVLDGRRRAQTQPSPDDSPPTARSTTGTRKASPKARPTTSGGFTSPIATTSSRALLGPSASLSGSGVRLGHSASTPSHQPLLGAFSQASLAARGTQDASLGVMRPLSTRNSGAAQRFFRFESMDAVAENGGNSLASSVSGLGGSFAGPVGLLFGSTASPGTALPPNNAASYRALRPSASRRAMRPQASPGSTGGSLASGGPYSPAGFGPGGFPASRKSNTNGGYGSPLTGSTALPSGFTSPMMSQSASAVQLSKVKVATGGGGIAVRSVRRPRSPSSRYRAEEAGPPTDLSSMLTSSTILLRQQRGGAPLSPPSSGPDASPVQYSKRGNGDALHRSASGDRLLRRTNSGNSNFGDLGGSGRLRSGVDAAREWDVSPSPSLSPFRAGTAVGDDGPFYESPHSPHPGWVAQ